MLHVPKKYQNPKQSHRSNLLSQSSCVHYESSSVQCCQLYTRITIWISARQIGQPVPILTRVSTQVAQNRAWPQGTSATPSRYPIRHISDSSCCLQVPVAPAMWKSSQSRQWVMPWPLDGRRSHLRRWWTCRGAAAEHQCERRRCDSRRVGTAFLCNVPWNACFDARLVHQICTEVSGVENIGQCGRLSQLSWLLGAL